MDFHGLAAAYRSRSRASGSHEATNGDAGTTIEGHREQIKYVIYPFNTMRPKIGISCRIEKFDDHSQKMMGVHLPYLESIVEAGGTPIIVPLLDDPAILREIYDSLDGLLIPGGEDVHPRFYGELPHPKLGETSELRDAVEIQLIRWAYEDDLPVLGVCRGIQVINVALGGSLYQDLDDQKPSELQHSTADSPTMWEQEAHEMHIRPDSKLASVLGPRALAVNSLHHQAVKTLAPGLTSTAEAPDGTIEALEAKGRNFFLALQCHPEMLWQKSSDIHWLNLFKSFIAAAGN